MEFLLDNLPLNHPLLSTLLFTNPSVQHDLREKLESGDSKWMEAPGIPPHIDLFRKLDDQQKSIDALPGILEKRMEKVLEEKSVAAGNITREFLRLKIRSILQDVGLQRAQSIEPAHEDSRETRGVFCWLRWFGDIRRGYPPYQSTSSDDLDTPNKKATLSEWSMLMRHIICGIEEKTGLPMPAIRDEAQAVELFNTGYQTLKLKPSKRERRVTQIKLTTVLRLVREAESSRTRILPFTPRKRQKPANERCASNATERPTAQTCD
ncbi:hypothetical protein PHMEG_00014316 [Phytophthora megakarya]|uniref:Uncharacterized protein n=1 Tax=Phytophthora megakarya TaxID=4795 RepID=A0A225W5M8_9STRA|nr:hypothetical protein PHMEG_00014316 [Phytophthora megakarya]